jgi:hypothetical protein
VTRFKFLAIAAAVGLTSCGRSPAPPAAVATPVVAVIDPSDSMKPNEPPAAKAEPLADGGSFPFPDDTGGKALAKSLAPAAPPRMPAGVPVVPRERKLPAFLDAPGPVLPDAANSPPRLALAPIKDVRPLPLPDRVPPDLGGVVPDLPARPEVPTGSLVRIPARDVSQPAELPPLSPKPVADRAPLTDPTAEFTAASVISPGLPLRTAPAGFVRLNLPDPFENAGAAKVRTPVTEDPNRVLPR